MSTEGNGHGRVGKLCGQFVNIVEKALVGQALDRASHGEVSRAQYEGLRFVYLHPSCCIKDLAEGLGVSHPAAVKLVERLAAKELIGREVRDEDRRVVRLLSTPEGADLVTSVRQNRDDALSSIIKAMDAGEVDALKSCIDAFIRKALEVGVQSEKVCLHCGVEHKDGCPVEQPG